MPPDQILGFACKFVDKGKSGHQNFQLRKKNPVLGNLAKDIVEQPYFPNTLENPGLAWKAVVLRHFTTKSSKIETGYFI